MRFMCAVISSLMTMLRCGGESSHRVAQFFEDRLAWRTLLLLGLCVVIAVLVSSGVLHTPLIRILGRAEAVIGQYPTLGALTFLVFSAVSAMFAFLSTAVMVPVAVFTWGSTVTCALLWAGWIGGGIASYGLSRWLGRRLLDRLGARRLLHRLECWVRPDAPFGVVLILQMALPSELPGYMLGLVRYPLRKYCCALALAELPYAVATVFVGQGLIERRGGLILGVGLVVGVLSLVAVHVLRSRLSGLDPPATSHGCGASPWLGGLDG